MCVFLIIIVFDYSSMFVKSPYPSRDTVRKWKYFRLNKMRQVHYRLLYNDHVSLDCILQVFPLRLTGVHNILTLLKNLIQEEEKNNKILCRFDTTKWFFCFHTGPRLYHRGGGESFSRIESDTNTREYKSTGMTLVIDTLQNEPCYKHLCIPWTPVVSIHRETLVVRIPYGCTCKGKQKIMAEIIGCTSGCPTNPFKCRDCEFTSRYPSWITQHAISKHVYDDVP